MFTARSAGGVQLVAGTSTSTASTVTATAASITTTYPAGSASGDYLIQLVATNRNAAGTYTITTPSSWSAITNQNPSGSSDGKNFSVFGRFRGAETTVTVTPTVSTVLFTTIVAYQGATVNAINPVNVSTSTYSNTAGTVMTTPTVTTTTDNCALCLIQSSAQGSGTAFTDTWTAPAVALIDTIVNETSFGPVRWGETIATATQGGAGATGTFTVTASQSVLGQFLATLAIAKR